MIGFLLRYLPLLAVVVFAALFMHYTLPQRDVVRIVDAYERRVDFGWNRAFWSGPDPGTDALANRDVRFIDTVRPDGSVMVYRNEDTGIFGWPPYFKINSSNLNAQAKEYATTGDETQWVALTHYGWRSELMTIFPNAVSIRPVAGPDVRLFPWFNTVFLVVFALLLLGTYRLLSRLYRRRLAPAARLLASGAGRVARRLGRIGSHFRR